MKVRLYQIYDRVAEMVLGNIMASTRDAAAIRHFQEVLVHPESPCSKAPGDYELVYIGDQDTTTGEVEPAPVATIYTGHAWTQEREKQQRIAGVGIDKEANTEAARQPRAVM